MKKRSSLDIFGLSFLDVISCSFAAMLALLMLAKNSAPVELPKPVNTIIDNSLPTDELENRKRILTEEVRQARAEIEQLSAELIDSQNELEAVEARVTEVQGIIQNTSSSAQVGTMESVYSGGVPVGAENIVFIIDTSGSMQTYWSFVVQTINEIMEAHPQVQGLQILSDNGEFLLPGYSGIFIPDTAAARGRATEKLRGWNAISNSSPAEGLETALKAYASSTPSLSIYVFGDDYTGASYDEVLDVIDRWNVDEYGNRLASIHGVGFPWGIGDRYATLMKEVAYRNKGVFLGL